MFGPLSPGPSKMLADGGATSGRLARRRCHRVAQKAAPASDEVDLVQLRHMDLAAVSSLLNRAAPPRCRLISSRSE
jgi:hypothetical protein